MKSTGEVMGLDRDFARAFAKAQLGAGVVLPHGGAVFISVRDEDKDAMAPLAKELTAMGFEIVATSGTARFLETQGLTVRNVNKVLEGPPHIVDAMIDGEIDLIFNTTEGRKAVEDSFSLRRTALIRSIPYYTTVSGAKAATLAIQALKADSLDVAPLQSYFKSAF